MTVFFSYGYYRKTVPREDKEPFGLSNVPYFLTGLILSY